MYKVTVPSIVSPNIICQNYEIGSQLASLIFENFGVISPTEKASASEATEGCSDIKQLDIILKLEEKSHKTDIFIIRPVEKDYLIEERFNIILLKGGYMHIYLPFYLYAKVKDII